MRFLRIGTAGMRGRIGNALTPLLAIDFASALGTYLEGGKVVIAMDTRFSSKMLHHAAVSALLSSGCQVFDADIASAPLLHFMVSHLEADAGLLLGAGHHPAGWNAMMPLDRNGAYYNEIKMQELLDVYHSHRYRHHIWRETGRIENVATTVADDYFDYLCGQLDTTAIRKADFNVVTDFCNGSGSTIAGKFADRLGIRLVPINDIISGILPHDPEPRPRSSTQVQSIVRALSADVGFVFNSDMSRTAVVTSSGETLSEEYTFPIVANHVLAKVKTGKTVNVVVTNTCTTRTLDDIISRHRAQVDKTKVGQGSIIDRMIELNAVLAGDGSGSIAINNSVPGFDSFLTMGIILEAMAVKKCSSAALAEELPRYHIVKRKVSCPSAHAYTLLHHLRKRFPDSGFPEAELSTEDGLRFDWADGWIHLRASMTEPVIRMIVEWKTMEEAMENAMRMRGLLERLVAS